MGQFTPQLRFVDTHARGDKKNGYQFEIKPDISVYHESLADAIPAGCNSSLLDMHIEFKRLSQDDPFLSPPAGPRIKRLSFKRLSFKGLSLALPRPIKTR